MPGAGREHSSFDVLCTIIGRKKERRGRRVGLSPNATREPERRTLSMVVTRLRLNFEPFNRDAPRDTDYGWANLARMLPLFAGFWQTLKQYYGKTLTLDTTEVIGACLFGNFDPLEAARHLETAGEEVCSIFLTGATDHWFLTIPCHDEREDLLHWNLWSWDVFFCLSTQAEPDELLERFFKPLLPFVLACDPDDLDESYVICVDEHGQVQELLLLLFYQSGGFIQSPPPRIQ